MTNVSLLISFSRINDKYRMKRQGMREMKAKVETVTDASDEKIRGFKQQKRTRDEGKLIRYAKQLDTRKTVTIKTDSFQKESIPEKRKKED